MTTAVPHFPKEGFEQLLERLRAEMRKREAGMVFYMYTSACGLVFSESVLVNRDRAHSLSQSPRVLFQTSAGFLKGSS